MDVDNVIDIQDCGCGNLEGIFNSVSVHRHVPDPPPPPSLETPPKPAI